jgi:uncharacterized membrane protein YdjX (TVP38/TMEM64 family)
MKKETRRFVLPLVFFVLLAGVIALVTMYFLRDLQDPEYQYLFSEWVADLGFFGMFVLLGIQILQIVVAIIPGGPVQMIAGAAYGVWKGMLIMIVGCIIATVFIFFLVKKFGVPLVRRFFGAQAMETWGFLSNSKRTAQVIFIFYLIPGTPKDFFVYLGPLTRLSLLQFTVISVFGRLPVMFSSTAMGDAAIRGNWPLFFAIFGVTALAGIFGIQFRDKIQRRLIEKEKEQVEAEELQTGNEEEKSSR